MKPLAVATLILAGQAVAQEFRASISGQIADTTGAAVAGAAMALGTAVNFATWAELDYFPQTARILSDRLRQTDGQNIAIRRVKRCLVGCILSATDFEMGIPAWRIA